MKRKDIPYVRDYTECDFEDTLLYQPYFSYNWATDEYYKVHSSIIDTIKAWACICTEPNEGIHYFNNQSAMFAALDMIYKLIDEAEKGGLEFDNEVRGETTSYIVPGIISLSKKKDHASERTKT